MSDAPSAAKQAWIQRVLGVAVALDGTMPAASPPADAKQLAERWTGLVAQVRGLATPGDLLGQLQAAGAALKAQDLAAAATAMDAIEAGLSQARAGSAAAEIAASAVSKVGVVAFAKLRLRWSVLRRAYLDARDNMNAVCDAVLSDPEAADDPQFEEMQAAAAEIGDRLPPPPATLDDLIQAMSTGDEARRAAARKAALAAVRAYRAELDAEPALKGLQDLPDDGLPIYDMVSAALNDLADALTE